MRLRGRSDPSGSSLRYVHQGRRAANAWISSSAILSGEVASIVDALIAKEGGHRGRIHTLRRRPRCPKVQAGVAALAAIKKWEESNSLASMRISLPSVPRWCGLGPQPDASKGRGDGSAQLQTFTPHERAVLYGSASDSEEKQIMEAAHAVGDADQSLPASNGCPSSISQMVEGSGQRLCRCPVHQAWRTCPASATWSTRAIRPLANGSRVSLTNTKKSEAAN